MFMKRGLTPLGKNKRGAEMAVGTIVIIVLAVLVLVFLVWGFSSGWSNLWSKITSYTGGGSNSADIKQACQLACDGGQVNDYCLNVRTIKLSDGKVIKGSCKNFENPSIGIGLNCPEVTCKADATYMQTCSDIGGREVSGACDDKSNLANPAKALEAGKVCCVAK
jgi:hypothetical protein